jgi:hypothetical protein
LEQPLLVLDPWQKDGYEIRAEVGKSLGELESIKRNQSKAKKLVAHLDIV